MSSTITTVTAAALVASAAALFAGIATAPAAALPDPAQWPGLVEPIDHDRCPLERVGTQFVECDYLTGAGVAAPSYIPEHP